MSKVLVIEQFEFSNDGRLLSCGFILDQPYGYSRVHNIYDGEEQEILAKIRRKYYYNMCNNEDNRSIFEIVFSNKYNNKNLRKVLLQKIDKMFTSYSFIREYIRAELVGEKKTNKADEEAIIQCCPLYTLVKYNKQVKLPTEMLMMVKEFLYYN